MKNIIKKIIVKVLEIEARLMLRKCKPMVIAVSGSVGKTSTKDAIFAAISPYKSVRRSEKSFNSEFGLPLTILDLPTGWNSPWIWMKNIIKGMAHVLFDPRELYPKVLVLEIGADRPGDIARIATWLPVDIVVLTRCPEIPVHVEYFKNPRELNEEDKKIIKALKVEGLLILNADDPEQQDLYERAKCRIATYGLEQLSVLGEQGGDLLIKQHLYPKLTAMVVAEELKLDLEKVKESLKNHKAPNGRMNIIRGLHDTTLIDDTYNSSPVAVEEALRVLSKISNESRRVAVLGDMFELGKFTINEHRRLGKMVNDCADALVTVGMRAEDFAFGAHEAGMHHAKIHSFIDTESAGKYLVKHTHPRDIILIKGSQGMRMEKIVKLLMAEPEKAKELLVRQEEEWANR